MSCLSHCFADGLRQRPVVQQQLLYDPPPASASLPGYLRASFRARLLPSCSTPCSIYGGREPAARREEELAPGSPFHVCSEARHEARRLAKPFRVGLPSTLPWHQNLIPAAPADAAACVPADSGEGVVGVVPWHLPWEADVYGRVPRAAAHVQVPADRRQAALSPERLQRWQDLHVDHQPTRVDARLRQGRQLVRVRDDQAGEWHWPIRHSECRLTLPARPVRRRRSYRGCKCSWTSRPAALRGEKRPTICTTITAPSTTSE